MGKIWAMIFSIVVSLSAFLLAGWLYQWVKKQDSNNEKIHKISELIRSGANTFLRKEYIILAKFAGVIALLMFVFLPEPIWKTTGIVDVFENNLTIMFAYIFGTVFSAMAGKIGIFVATIANKKTAEAAQKGIRPSFLSGFR
ncbi:MAG: sodium/proton-translocating pyrophosphatase, partial [Candidatus Izemoplasmatales bacterium]|nr:sodium/proton-translocating pyrophosphatase [Candidatus Izemoplasmatales bacterium]